MKDYIEEQTLLAYQDFIQAIKNDELEKAVKLQQIINELKQQLESIK